MSKQIDECWIRLAEAIITDGIHAYVRAAQSLQAETEKTIRNNNPRITDYLQGKDFIMLGCNGLVGGDPETLLSDVNAKYKINAEKIEYLIEKSKRKRKRR